MSNPISLTLVDQLLAMASGAWVTQMINVAAELGLADALAGGEQDVQNLARTCSADADALFRLLRGLASLGLFSETAPGRFSLTPLGALLGSDHPQSLRHFARMLGEEHYLSWNDLLHSVRTGENAFRHRHGQSIFEWYQHHGERGEIFDRAMGDFSRQEATALLEAYPLSDVRHIVDVGGGRGGLLMAALQTYDHLRGTLYDQPWVVEPVEIPEELEGRLTLNGGDFFSTVPAGADAYLLKHIIHDWDDTACLRILKAIRSAMAPGARVLIVEQVIPPGNAPFPGKLLDLNMLVMTEGGRERTAAEYTSLLDRAELQLSRIVPTSSPVSVVEAVAAT